MTVQAVNTIARYTGASGDTPPTAPRVGSTYYETDTGKRYIFTTSWVQYAESAYVANLYPITDNTYDLGSAALSFNDLHVQNLIYATSVVGNWSPSVVSTYSLGTIALEWQGLYLGDDTGVFIGLDQDDVIYHRTATLTADEELTGVIVGTSIHPATAANTFILSNITTDGDILILASDGGNSKAGIFIDASVPSTTIYNAIMSAPDISGVVTAASALTLPAFTMSGHIVPDTDNAYDIGDYATSKGIRMIHANATDFAIQQVSGAGVYLRFLGNVMQLIATTIKPFANIQFNTDLDIQTRNNASGYVGLEGYGSGAYVAHARIDPNYLTLVNGKLEGDLLVADTIGINTGVADDDYFTIGADDTGVGIVEVARAQGAADPYFSMGGSQEFKFYYSGVATFGGAVTSTSTTGFATTATFVPDATRTNYAYSIGNRAVELTVNLANDASQNFEPFQMNVNLTASAGAPTSTSTARLLRIRSTHDTVDMPNLRIMNINTYMDVRKNMEAAYGQMNGVDFQTNAVTITTEAAVGVFNMDAVSAVTGAVRGIIINLHGAGLPSTTSIGLEVRTDGGTATLAEGIRVWSVGGNSVTTAIKMQGTMTNIFDFTSIVTAVLEDNLAAPDKAGSIAILTPAGAVAYINYHDGARA